MSAAMLGLVACLALSSCSSEEKPAVADPTGHWQHRVGEMIGSTAPQSANYLFIRYEFKSDATFTREEGPSNVPEDVKKVSGSWKIEPIVIEKESSWGKAEATKLKRGTLVLSYHLTRREDMPLGATLLGETGKVMDPGKSFHIQQSLVVIQREDDGEKRLTLGKQTFVPFKP